MKKFFVIILFLILSFNITGNEITNGVQKSEYHIFEFTPAIYFNSLSYKSNCSGGTPQNHECVYETKYKNDFLIGIGSKLFLYENDFIEFDLIGLGLYFASEKRNNSLWFRLLGFYYKFDLFKFGVSLFPFMGDIVIGNNMSTMSTLKFEIIYNIKGNFNIFTQFGFTSSGPGGIDDICARDFYFFDGYLFNIGLNYNFKLF